MLTLLEGVGWPSASVILRFFHPQPYPILDYRALWSLNSTIPGAFRFDFWKDYANHCRSLSKKHSISMRALDHSLWQFSKENQR